MALDLYPAVERHINDFDFTEALETIWKFIRRTNKYIDETEPWRLSKEENGARLDNVLFHLAEAIRFAALLIAPFMEETARRIFLQIGCDPESEIARGFENLRWGGARGNKVRKGEILFPRREEGKKKEKREPAPEKMEKQAPRGVTFITYDDFTRVSLRAGIIETAEEIPGADKLYALTIRIGEETRTIAAGIKAWYAKEELPGKAVVVVTNLEPRKLRGIVSEGMLLAASTDKGLSLVTLDRKDDFFNGAVVR